MTQGYAALLGERTPLDIAIGDDPKAISLHYSLATLTPRMIRKLTEMSANQASPEAIEIVVQALSALVTDWNLRPSEDLPIVGLTEDELLDVPWQILGTVVIAIMGDAGPKGATGSASPTPSSIRSGTKSKSVAA